MVLNFFNCAIMSLNNHEMSRSRIAVLHDSAWFIFLHVSIAAAIGNLVLRCTRDSVLVGVLEPLAELPGTVLIS